MVKAQDDTKIQWKETRHLKDKKQTKIGSEQINNGQLYKHTYLKKWAVRKKKRSMDNRTNKKTVSGQQNDTIQSCLDIPRRASTKKQPPTSNRDRSRFIYLKQHYC